MAKRNMHCGFRRTSIQTDAGQDPFKSRPKDCEVSSDMWRTNSNNRCTLFTFIAVEPTGHCRIVSVPLECSGDTINLGSKSGERYISQKGPTTNRGYFIKSVTGRSNFQHQSQQNEDDQLGNKEDKTTKRNPKKKPKKKGKRNKKLLLSENGVSEQGCVNACSTSEADAKRSSADTHVKSCIADVDTLESSGMSVPQDFISSSNNKHQLPSPENGQLNNTLRKPMGSCDSQYSNVGSEQYDSTGLLDSMSLASNSEYSFNADEEKLPHYAVKKCSSPIEKKEKQQQIKRSAKNPKIYRSNNLHGRIGKENSHSVWQRVERHDAAVDDCANNSSTKPCSQLEIGSKQDKQSNVLDSDISLNTVDDKSRTKPRRMKRKSIKQESYAVKSCSNLGRRNNVERIVQSVTPAQMSGQKEIDFDSSKVDCPRNGFQFEKVELDPFRPFHKTQCCCELEALENVCSTVSGSSNSPDPPELVEELVDEQKLIKQISPAEQTRQESSSGTVMQKWVAVGVKDPDPDSSSQTRSLPITLQEESTCRSQLLVPKETVHVNKCPTLETEGLKNDLSKMGCALNEVKMAQQASEAIYNATGCPIAEFEKLIHCASPIIFQSDDIVGYQRCFCNQIMGTSLYMHEMPNIKLGNLWEWYEEHGINGLQVMADDYETSKRIGMDSVAFRAYYVPSLSAIQLFRRCKHDEVPHMVATNTDHLPTLELLFEYFESEQPQKRPPLFDVIKELVKRNLQSGAYGDPTILESISLNDLHPESWYSVAWYPIYAIPDGSLRAAFLTYHSLGQLVRRSSPSFDSRHQDISIVSPVVGLQSYNAQGECWFRLRQKETIGGEEGSSNLNLAGVLKERIRTLEHTASLMARGTVTKGTQSYINRQPDYEFFISRRC